MPAPKVTSSLYICDPVVVTEPPLIAVVPPVFVVKLPMLTVLESVVVPALLRFKEEAPLTAPPKVTSPDVFAVIVEFAVKTIAVSVSPIDIVVFVD